MAREEKIKAIYEEMANKELTFGCKLQVIESEGPIQGVIFNVVSEEYKVLWDDKKVSTETKNNDFSVIGHPVMIGDVLEYAIQSGGINTTLEVSEDLIDQHWWNYNTCIDDQSDECIDYVYSLIGNKNE